MAYALVSTSSLMGLVIAHLVYVFVLFIWTVDDDACRPPRFRTAMVIGGLTGAGVWYALTKEQGWRHMFAAEAVVYLIAAAVDVAMVWAATSAFGRWSVSESGQALPN